MAKQITVAAIDVGSHDIFMKIAVLKSGEPPRIIDEVQRTIPVGSDTYTAGNISQHLLNQSIEVLKSFNKKFDEYKVSKVRAVATSAFREAGNRLFAVEQIRRQAGIDVEVLTNSMDMYYHQMALSETVPDFMQMVDANALILNIGSGSIQLTLFNEGKYINTQNFRLGSLRIRELLGDLERHSSDFNALMAEYISGELNYYRTFGPKKSAYQNLIILGGSSRYIRHVAGWNGKHPGQIQHEEFDVFFKKLKKGEDKADMARLSQIPTEQETLLIPACIVIDEVLQFTGADQFYLSEIDLADGLLFEMAAEDYNYKFKRNPEVNILESALSLASRYRTDKKHSHHVSELSTRLFDLTVRLHGLPKIARQYLQIASVLHNIGKYVSIENDGIRSYNIIMSNEIIGLDERETKIVGLIACFHNGHITMEEPLLQTFPDADKIMILKLIALLALANSLDAGHKQKIEILKTKLESDNTLGIYVQSRLDNTLETWNFNKHTRLFQAIFGLQPVLKTRTIKNL